MAISRKDVLESNQWDTSSLYSDWQKWQEQYQNICSGQQIDSTWPQLLSFRNSFLKGPEQVKKALQVYFDLDAILTRLYTYAHLRHDEDIAHDEHKQSFQRISNLYHQFSQESAWIRPELLALPKEQLQAYLQDDHLAEYRVFLQKILHLQDHSLSAEQEELIALAGQPLSASQRAFSALNNADLSFGTITDDAGKSHELTHASYQIYLRHSDRVLRKHAFETMQSKYQEHENTLCELLQGQVQTHHFHAKSHKYSSCLQAALHPKNVDPAVYRNLIKAVHKGIGSLHKYLALRKKILKLPQLHFYDLYVPLIQTKESKVSYEQAVDSVIASVAPLGEEYQKVLSEGLRKQGWVDRYENQYKRSGAYSSGCYGSHPYILLNFASQLNDMFTLAHEAGHSMHSYLSWKTQPYHQADYPIFVAEVASTFNEELLLHYLLQQSNDAQTKAYLINHKLEDIRATLFRQTMFAEFELLLHEMVENKQPLTPQRLREEYIKLNQFYFGPDVHIDEAIGIEWARIPHFYYNFYVYQYATGISAALSLTDKVLQGGGKERLDYITFLKSGGSRYPIDLLKTAGVDLTTTQPIEQAIAKFDACVDQLESIIS